MAQLWRAQVSGGAAIWAASNGDGAPTTPTFGTITTAATSITFAHSGGGTHYRIYATGGSAGSWVSLSSSPVTVSSLTTNQPYTIELSSNGSTVAATTNTGTTNPGSGSGEPVPAVPVNVSIAAPAAHAATAAIAASPRRAETTLAAQAAHIATAAIAAAARQASATIAAAAAHNATAGLAATVADPPSGEVDVSVAASAVHAATAGLAMSARFSASVAAIGVHAATAGILAQVRSAITASIAAQAAHSATAGIAATVADSATPVYAFQPTTASSWSYKQTATLWALTGRADWTGERTFAAPVLFYCDYMLEAKMAVSSRGDEFVSKLTLYTSLPGIKQGDMVLIGTSTNPDPVATDAEEVQAATAYADTFNAGGPEDFKVMA